ncbi:MAG: GGDEF domain-containing protein [Rhizobiaceae bacterium]
MHDFQANQLKQPPAALSQPLLFGQEKAILDILSDGVFIIEAPLIQNTAAAEFTVQYVNETLRDLVKKDAVDILDQSIGKLFPQFYYAALYDAISQAQILLTRQDVEITYKARNSEQQLRIALMPRRLSSKSTDQKIQIVGCINNVTPLAKRASYLENRAVKLIDHANGLETSRRDLESKVKSLHRSIKKLERTARYDKISGLSKRVYFLEQGAAEFQRSKRYGHTLSLAVISLQGLEKIAQAHGVPSLDKAITGLAQICETACRSGIDMAGRINENEIAMILPETNLTGALQFMDRLTALVGETPIQLNNGFVRLGIRSGIDTMQVDDHSFMQSLIRAQKGLAE